MDSFVVIYYNPERNAYDYFCGSFGNARMILSDRSSYWHSRRQGRQPWLIRGNSVQAHMWVRFLNATHPNPT